MTKQVPLTLLTGFLGAGKTTLLNRILTEHHGEKIAVIVNEFGDIGIDDKLIKRHANGIVELENGCICCSVKDSTLGTLLKLMDDRKDMQTFDRVIIETTGIANPIPFVRAFLSKPMLKEYYMLDGVITVVDAAHIMQQLEQTTEAREQIAIADVILLNKTDLVDNDAKLHAIQQIKTINEHATLVQTERSMVDISTILDIRAFDIEAFNLGEPAHDSHKQTNGGVHSIVLREEHALNLDSITRWIGEALMLNADKLMRYKGILHIAGRENRMIFQGVHTHFENTDGDPWNDDVRVSEVVLIGRDLDKEFYQRTFSECVQER